VLAGATLPIVLAVATDSPATGNATHVKTGSVIKAVYVEMWVRGSELSPGTALLTLVKIPGAGGVPTFAQLVALHTYNNKKNIFYHTQGLTQDANADATPFMRGWFKIPKSKQRFGLDDILDLSVSAQALDHVICGFATYKEYF